MRVEVRNQPRAVLACPLQIVGDELDLVQRRQSIRCAGGAVCRKAAAFRFDVAFLSAGRGQLVDKGAGVFALLLRCTTHKRARADLIAGAVCRTAHRNGIAIQRQSGRRRSENTIPTAYSPFFTLLRLPTPERGNHRFGSLLDTPTPCPRRASAQALPAWYTR